MITPDPAYEHARTAAIVVDRSDRAVMRVFGRDPVKMIQGLITNDLVGAPTSRVTYAAVLTAKGRMVADLRALKHGADVWLEVAIAARDTLTAHLRKFVPPLFAKFQDMPELVVIGVYGPAAQRILEVTLLAAIDVAEDASSVHTFSGGEVVVIGTGIGGMPGADIIIDNSRADVLRSALLEAGAMSSELSVLETLRIEAGVPRWGTDLDETVIPLEAGLRSRAISETKGCYTGQEVIIRILHRGHVNWTLRGVHLSSPDMPAKGDTLTRAEDGRIVGRITSAAFSPRLGHAIALAYVRREIEPGTVLLLGAATHGTMATVTELPFAAATAAASS